MHVLKRHILIALYVIGGLTAASAAAYIYMKFDPAESAMFPRCIFHELTGLSCPGCGSQRAIHALLNLDLRGALGSNALLVASLPFMALLVFAWLVRRRIPGLYARLGSAAAVWTVFAVIILWWIMRNIFGI